jgi:hypothetical protein
MRSRAASLTGTSRGSYEPPVADPDAGEYRGVPLPIDITSCKGMPWPLNRDKIHQYARYGALWSS